MERSLSGMGLECRGAEICVRYHFERGRCRVWNTPRICRRSPHTRYEIRYDPLGTAHSRVFFRSVFFHARCSPEERPSPDSSQPGRWFWPSYAVDRRLESAGRREVYPEAINLNSEHCGLTQALFYRFGLRAFGETSYSSFGLPVRPPIANLLKPL